MLRPGGRLAAFWHVFQLPPKVAEAFAAVFRRVVPDSPFSVQPTRPALDLSQVLFPKAEQGIRHEGRFSDPEQWRYDWEQPYTRDAWLDQLPTSGALTRLPPDQLAEVLDGRRGGHRQDRGPFHDVIRHGGHHRSASEVVTSYFQPQRRL